LHRKVDTFFFYKNNLSELGMLRQEDFEFKATLSYRGRCCPKKQNTTKQRKKKTWAGM
jgi:hypothetical protein